MSRTNLPAHGYWVHSDPTQAPASTTVCPGRHNDPARAAALGAPDTATAHPATYGDPVWCTRCTNAVRAAIQFLPGLAHALETEIEEATDLAPERVSGTRARALHEHQAQALLIDEIRDTFAQLEDLVREWRRLTARRRELTIHVAIERSSRFLLAHLDWILTHAPDTEDPDEHALIRYFVEHLRSLDRRAMRLTHQQEAKPEDCIGVPCRECDMRTLVRAIDRRTGAPLGEIQCENCGARESPETYHTLSTQWGIYEYEHLDQAQREIHHRAVIAYERTRAAA